MAWIESWAMIIILVCILCALTTVLLCCVCWNKKLVQQHQSYILDEDGLHQVADGMSATDSSAARNNQKGKTLLNHIPLPSIFVPKTAPAPEWKRCTSKTDLIRSAEAADASSLHLEDNNNLVPAKCDQGKDDDAASCNSNASKRTFCVVQSGEPVSSPIYNTQSNPAELNIVTC